MIDALLVIAVLLLGWIAISLSGINYSLKLACVLMEEEGNTPLHRVNPRYRQQPRPEAATSY